MLITFDLDGVLMLNPFGSGVFPYVRKVISEQSGADPQDVRKAITAEAVKRQ
ncbi:MAG: HAD family hydrolase, partial [Firmicutes bacterium]|nr:HAD family hydrolase [Bacillota bacterium]